MGEFRTGMGRRAPADDGRFSDEWLDIKALSRDLYVLTDWLGDSHPRFGPILTHSYMLLGSRRAALIDSGLGIGDLLRAVRAITDLPVEILLTHNHSDHIGGAFAFDRVSVGRGDADQLAWGLTDQDASFVREYALRNSRDLPAGFDFAQLEPASRWARRPNRVLAAGDSIDLGQRSLRVLETPGHTPGSCCYLEASEGLLFTGDTAYEGNLNLQLDRSDFRVYPQSAASLLAVSADLRVLPGHYSTPIGAGIVQAISDGLTDIARGNARFRAVTSDWLEADFETFSITIPSSAQSWLAAASAPGDS